MAGASEWTTREDMTGKTSRLPPAHRRFKPYPAYKDSGVEWLGEIPAHWDVAPVYARYEVALGKMLDAKRVTGESSGCYLRNIDVQWDSVNAEGLPEMDFAPWERERYLVRPGDLLVCEGGEVGRTAIWRGDIAECFYQKAIHRVRSHADKETPRFFYYLMHTLAKQGVFAAGGNPNTIDHLTAVQLRHYRLPFAPPNEQCTIAAFLDRETTRIDGLVTKKEQLIELLHEKRSALITRAVSKGLDPSAPMKDSGLEWLGRMPTHWDVVPVRSLARPGHKTFTDGDWIESPFIRDEGIRLIQTGNIGTGEYREQGFRYIDDETFTAFRCTEVQPGDVLICRLADPVGRACRAPDLGCRMITSVDVCILKSAPSVDPGFLVHAFSGSGYLSWLGGLCRGGTRDRVSRSMLGAIRVPLPPVAEQGAISEFLDRETARIDGLVAKVWEAIDRLKELRIALISAAVTGKIDVRDPLDPEGIKA